MKTAFVHDRIAHEGGAESVLRELISRDQHDEGIIFTFYSKLTRRKVGDNTYRIVTALPYRLNKRFIICNSRKFFVLSTLFDYRNLMFRFPLLTSLLSRKLKKYNPDHTIISSFAAAKNIQNAKSKIQNKSTVTLYLHSPMQYIRENYHDNIQKLRFPIKQLYQLATYYLRPRDRKNRHYDQIFFNSEYTQTIAEKLYHMKGVVQYPSLDPVFHTPSGEIERQNYYIFMGRVVKYVREIDKIISLFNNVGVPLIVVGDGPDLGYAQSIAGSNIIFTGHVDDVEEKKKLLEQSRGLINTAKESFGLSTAEALCSGVPVFGFNGGATKYLINENNGLLVDTKDEKSLLEGFEKFMSQSFDRKKIAENAQKKFFD